MQKIKTQKTKIERYEQIINPFVQNRRETKEPRRGSQVESDGNNDKNHF